MAVALIVKKVLLLGLMTLHGAYSEDAPKCKNAECEKEDVSSLLQSRVQASLESRIEEHKELDCTFVAMMEEDTSIGEQDSTDDGLMWGECMDASGVTHYLFDDEQLENFGPGDKLELTVSEVSGAQLPTAPNLPWQSDNVPLYRIVSVNRPDLLIQEDSRSNRGSTGGATTTKEVDVIMMICNYKDQNAFVTDEKRLMDSFYQKLGEKLYSTRDGRGSFADMLNASSYGRFTAPRSKGKVVTVTINKNFPTNGCPYNDMARDCKQATRDQTAFDPDDFTFREFFIPTKGSGCRWGGLANVGCGHYSRVPRKAACHAWYRSDRPFVRAHEIGHNLGFLHAGGDWGRGGTYVEYGDPQASMGASYTFSSFNAASRYQGGFLRKVAGEAVEFQPDFNAGNSGTFKLQSLSKPLGEPGADAVAVFWSCPKCVPKVSSHSRNVGGYLWLQFRGDEGYSASKLGSNFQNKVYVHLARKYHSIYYGKGTEMWQMMGKGASYRPPNSEATVTVNDIVGDLATVTIQVGNPTTQAPTPAPTTEAPTTEAPTTETPTTKAPTTEAPTTEAPTTEATTTEAPTTEAPTTEAPTTEAPSQLVPGLKEEVYYGRSRMKSMPTNLDSPSVVRVVKQPYYQNTWRTWPGFSRSSNFAVRWTGSIKIGTSGSYTWCTSSDDGSKLYIDDAVVVNNDGLHAWRTKCSAASVKSGYSKLTVTFFEYYGHAGIEVQYSGADTSNKKVRIPSSVLFNDGKVPKPPCIDKYSQCPGWAKHYCTGRWASWMATNCQKSCSACS